MKRIAPLLVLPLALVACDVDRDAANDTTEISINEAKVDRTLDQAGNVIEDVAEDARNAAEKAGPALENAADDVGAAARGAGRAVENSADRAAGEVREETRDNPPKSNQ